MRRVYEKKKRPLTLLEIMIVILLIGLIGSVIGFNMKGSLDEGKAFKTRQAQEQIKDIFMLEIARGTSMDEVLADQERYLEASGLVKNPSDFLKDGWNMPFEIKANGNKSGEIIVRSERLKVYDQKRKQKLGKPAEADEDDD